MRVSICSALACLALIQGGCGKKEDGKLPVFKVKGEIYVNGQPAEYVRINFHPRVPNPEHPMLPYAHANDKGEFEASTYVQGDGLPAGEYTLTFEWRGFNIMTNSFSGPDKLGEQFAKLESSQHQITVGEAPVDVPRIELTAKLAATPTGSSKFPTSSR